LDSDSLRRLPSLKHLSLSDNSISHISSNVFIHTKALSFLDLSGNLVSHTIEDAQAPFKGLANLTSLKLDRNRIKSVGQGALKGLRALEELSLMENPVSSLSEAAFQNSLSLFSLKLDSSSLLCDCHLRWLWAWAAVRDGCCSRATCAHPEALKGRSVDCKFEFLTVYLLTNDRR